MNKKLISLLLACAMALCLVPTMAMAAEDALVLTRDGGMQPTETDYTYSDGIMTIKGAGPYTLTMASGVISTTDRVVVTSTGGVSLTLHDVTINIDEEGTPAFLIAEGAGDVLLTVKGTNSLTSGKYCAGLEKKSSAKLRIWGADTGSLSAQGGEQGAGIGGSFKGAGSNITIESGKVTATGGKWGAGIGGGGSSSSKGSGVGSNITINGGEVKATGGEQGAGIGGGEGGAGIGITINGGEVTARGGEQGAGIGGGLKGAGSSITINGGTVTATGGSGGIGGIGGSGAGIGGGGSSTGGIGNGNNITITGGTVTATGGARGAGIGGGNGGKGENITVSGGTVTAEGKGGSAAIGSGSGGYTATDIKLKPAPGGWFDITHSNIEARKKRYNTETVITEWKDTTLLKLSFTTPDLILSRDDGTSPAADEYSYSDSSVLTIKGTGPYTLKMASGKTSTTDRVVVTSTGGVSLTLNGVKIRISEDEENAAFLIAEGAGAVSLTLKNESSLTSGYKCAGLEKKSSAKLCILGTGSLTAEGGENGAGIGGGSGGDGSNITINGGTVTATGGNYGAGIGGGERGDGDNITINGGTVTANGGKFGAGIGGGANGDGGNITISGGTVTATGGQNANAIEGGQLIDNNVIRPASGWAFDITSSTDEGHNRQGWKDVIDITSWEDTRLIIRFKPAAPSISPNGGKFDESQTVSITCEAEGATIYYTTDGDDPRDDEKQVKYTAPFTLNHTTTVKAVAEKDGVCSDIATAEFTQRINPNIGAVTAGTDTVYFGTELTDIGLSRSNTTIEGDLAWSAGQTLAMGANECEWTFTPDDTETYRVVKGKITITVREDTLQSIAVKTPPAKLEYSYGESFDKTGLVLTATYQSGKMEDVTAERITIADTALAVGQTEITVSYGGLTCAVTGLRVNKAEQTIMGGDFSAQTGTTVELADKFSAQGALRYEIAAGDKTGSSISASSLRAGSTAGTCTLKISAAETANYKAAQKTVTVTVTAAPVPPTPPTPSPSGGTGGGSGGSNEGGYIAPAQNSAQNENADIRLSGVNVPSGDALITTPTQNGALMKLLGDNTLVGMWDIKLQSGRTSIPGSTLSFNVGKENAGKMFTLYHQKADGTVESFSATADAQGIVSFYPIHSLSPFMLVEGGGMATTSIVSVPATGDVNVGLGLLLLSAMMAAVLMKRRKAQA